MSIQNQKGGCGNRKSLCGMKLRGGHTAVAKERPWGTSEETLPLHPFLIPGNRTGGPEKPSDLAVESCTVSRKKVLPSVVTQVGLADLQREVSQAQREEAAMLSSPCGQSGKQSQKAAARAWDVEGERSVKE